MSNTTPELLNIEYDEINDVPGICINHELTLLITNFTFIKSYINMYNNKNYLGFSNLKCSKLRLCPYKYDRKKDFVPTRIVDDDEIGSNKIDLEEEIRKEFDVSTVVLYDGKTRLIGYASADELYTVFNKILYQLKEIR